MMNAQTPAEWTFEAVAPVPLALAEWRGVRLPARFAPPGEELRHARSPGGALLFDRSERGAIAVSGRDQKSWLHNLLTNDIKSLTPGVSCYAFAIDVRGRLIFDLNVLDLGETLWLDLDRPSMPAATAHLERYHISEDVALAASDEVRLGVCGAAAGRVAETLGAVWSQLAPCGHQPIEAGDGPAIRLWRSQFAGADSFELILPHEMGPAIWTRVSAIPGVRPGGLETLDLLRIEAEIPWPGRELDERTLPPETGDAAARGIHYRKGCYLGQEIIERMRSHGSLARRLVRVRVDDGAGVALPAPLTAGGADAGRITSLAAHPDGGWIGLAYVRTSVAPETELTAGTPPRKVTVDRV